MRAQHRTTVRGGRTIGWWEWGSGPRAVLYCHGTPGCGREIEALRPSPRGGRAGAGTGLPLGDVRVIAPDRPGYGATSRLPGRTVAESVPDVEAILAECGVGKAAVLGYSGGGPHALAVAVRLPEVVSAQGLIAPAASHVGVRARVEVALARPRMALLSGAAAVPASWFGVVPGELGRALAGDHRRRATAFAQGTGGAVDDEVAITNRWGFSLVAAAPGLRSIPSVVWIGEGDRIVHPREGIGIARLIGATLVPHRELGHFGMLRHPGLVEELLGAGEG